MELQFKGRYAVVGLVIAALLVGLRTTTLGESNDPELEAAIRTELTSVLGGRTLQDLEAAGPAETMSTGAARRFRNRRRTVPRSPPHTARAQNATTQAGNP